jgi:hypothetical protein
MVTFFALHSRGEIVLWNAALHGLLGVLFVVAFAATSRMEVSL